MTDLKPLMGARFVRESERDCDDANRLPGPVDTDGQPISSADRVLYAPAGHDLHGPAIAIDLGGAAELAQLREAARESLARGEMYSFPLVARSDA